MFKSKYTWDKIFLHVIKKDRVTRLHYVISQTWEVEIGNSENGY